jgi:hypothetical protein
VRVLLGATWHERPPTRTRPPAQDGKSSLRRAPLEPRAAVCAGEAAEHATPLMASKRQTADSPEAQRRRESACPPSSCSTHPTCAVQRRAVQRRATPSHSATAAARACSIQSYYSMRNSARPLRPSFEDRLTRTRAATRTRPYRPCRHPQRTRLPQSTWRTSTCAAHKQ